MVDVVRARGSDLEKTTASRLLRIQMALILQPSGMASLSLSLQPTIVTTQNVIREERELRVIEVLKFLNASSFNL